MRSWPAWLALGVALCGFPGCPGAYVLPLPPEAQPHRVQTGDGWELSLVRYPAQGPPRGRPVLICHGISANARSIDIDPEHSLPRWLAAHGREAWTMSLRATGDSQGVDASQGRPADFPFEALWQQDVRAAVDYVRQVSGADRIDFVGHSMGGILLYAYLAEGGTGLNAGVTLGAPTRLDWGSAFLPLISRSVGWVGTGAVPVVASAHLAMPLQARFRNDPETRLLFNPDNTSAETWRRLISTGISDIQGGVARHFVQMMQTGSFSSADGKIDYRKDMAAIRTPILVVAGKADRLAVAPAVKDGYRALGGPKEWLLMGQENGAQVDYGHMDLVTGDRTSAELWPRLLDFLDRHPGDKAVVSAPPSP